MNWNKLFTALLFPHIIIMLILVPVSSVLLVGSMVYIGTNSIISYISYVLAAYTLTVWCIKIPPLIKRIKAFKNENKFAKKWKNDVRLRVNVSLYGALAWNMLYGLFQLWLGFYHHTFWFYTLGAYYICLALMRFFLVNYTRRYKAGENMHAELLKYRNCGWIFLILNLVLSVIVFFMVYWNKTFQHHMITAIAMASYTFTTLTFAIINVIKYKKFNSPAFSASKAISLAAAVVSVLTLEATMLTTFGSDTMSAMERKIMLGATGGAISVFIITMAIYMIIQGTKRLKSTKTEVTNGNKKQ